MKLILFLTSIILVHELSAQTITWEKTYGPPGGKTNFVTLGNDGFIYAGSASTTEIFFSRDFGLSWERISDNLVGAWAIHSIAVSTGGTIFTSFIDYNYSRGLFKSSDRGITWENSNENLSSELRSVYFNLNDELFSVHSRGKFVKSTDYGESWQEFEHEFAFKNPVFTDGIALLFVQDVDGNVYQSRNRGESWDELEGIKNLISVKRNNMDEIFLATKTNIYKTDENLENLIPISENLPTNEIKSFTVSGSGILYAATIENRIYRSLENGLTWQILSDSISGHLVSSSSQMNVVCITNDSEVYQFNEMSESWIKSEINFTGSESRVFAFKNKSIVYAISEGGLYYYSKEGNIWRKHNSNLPTTTTKIISDSKGYLYAVSNLDVFKSVDDGFTWTKIFTVGFAPISNPELNVFVDQNDNLYVSYINIFPNISLFGRSTDSGNNWEFNDSVQYISALCSRDESDVLALGGSSLEGITKAYISYDGGENWTINDISTTYNFGTAIRMVVRKNGDVIAVGETGGNTGSTISKSTDFGQSWKEIKHLWGDPIDIVITNNDDMILATFSWGIEFYRNETNAWYRSNTGLRSAFYITSLSMDSDGYLYQGTKSGMTYGAWYAQGDGVFRSKNSVTSLMDIELSIPLKFSLSQNYPNPFNPSTTIKYSIPVNSRQYTVGSRKHQSFNQPITQSNSNLVSVQLKVYDILGREIATLVNETKSAGNYEVEFSAKGGYASSLSSGVYFYRITMGSFVDTKKMVLMR